MDLTGDIEELQDEAESLMTDTCRITRPGTGEQAGTFNPATGLFTYDAQPQVYSGKCMIRVPGTVSTGKARPTAGDEASLLTAIFSIPFDGPRLDVNDDIVFLTSRYNQALVGRHFTVTGLLPGSQITKQRVSVEAVVG